MNDIKFERRLTDEQIKKEVALIYQKHAQPYEDETQRPFCQNNLNHWFGSTQQIVPNITKNMVERFIKVIAPGISYDDILIFARDSDDPLLFLGGGVLITRRNIFWKSYFSPLKKCADLKQIKCFSYQEYGPSAEGSSAEDMGIIYNNVNFFSFKPIKYFPQHFQDFLNEVLEFLKKNP